MLAKVSRYTVLLFNSTSFIIITMNVVLYLPVRLFVQCSTLHYTRVQYITVQYSVHVLHYSTLQYSTVQYSIIRYRMREEVRVATRVAVV